MLLDLVLWGAMLEHLPFLFNHYNKLLCFTPVNDTTLGIYYDLAITFSFTWTKIKNSFCYLP